MHYLAVWLIRFVDQKLSFIIDSLVFWVKTTAIYLRKTSLIVLTFWISIFIDIAQALNVVTISSESSL